KILQELLRIILLYKQEFGEYSEKNKEPAKSEFPNDEHKKPDIENGDGGQDIPTSSNSSNTSKTPENDTSKGKSSGDDSSEDENDNPNDESKNNPPPPSNSKN